MNLSEIQRSQLAEFAAQNNIRFVVLFGSQTQASPREGADFDIAVSVKGRKSFMSELSRFSFIIRK